MNEKIILVESRIMEIAFEDLSEERIALLKEVIEDISENIDAHNKACDNNEIEQ